MKNKNARASDKSTLELPQVFRVKVSPNSKSDRIQIVKNAQGAVIYKIAVTAIAEEGKANKAVIKLLSKTYGIAKSRIVIKRGETSPDKEIHIID